MSVLTCFPALCQLAHLPLTLAPVPSLQPYGVPAVLWMPGMLLPQTLCTGSFRYEARPASSPWHHWPSWLIFCRGSCPAYIVGYLQPLPCRSQQHPNIHTVVTKKCLQTLANSPLSTREESPQTENPRPRMGFPRYPLGLLPPPSSLCSDLTCSVTPTQTNSFNPASGPWPQIPDP